MVVAMGGASRLVGRRSRSHFLKYLQLKEHSKAALCFCSYAEHSSGAIYVCFGALYRWVKSMKSSLPGKYEFVTG